MIKSFDFEYDGKEHDEILIEINDKLENSSLNIINIETIITVSDYFVRVWYIE